MMSSNYRDNFSCLVAKILFQYYSLTLFIAWILPCSLFELCSGDAEVFFTFFLFSLAFHFFWKCSFCTSSLCCFQEWLYPKVKTVLQFFTAKTTSVWRECSVNWQYTDTPITAKQIESQELRQLKERQRETSRRAEAIFASAFTVWR